MNAEWDIPASERAYLRELAERQAQYAALPVMARRKEMWYALNDARPGARPPVVIETQTFDRDFLPDSVYRCGSQAGRQIERQLLRNVRNHELIDDDKVIPDEFQIGWFVDIDELGVTIIRHTIKDSQGVETAWKPELVIKDLRRDLGLLKPATCRVDREKTLAYKAFLEDLLGANLPVRIVTGVYGCAMLTYRVVELMGMEAFFLAMYDCPDQLHALMAYLRDNALRMMRWAEGEGLLRVNNGNQSSFGSSYNFTTLLPAAGHAPAAARADAGVGVPARLCDMWGGANSQETVGVSPAMFHEFCFPYYRDVCQPLGLLYFGCCEAAHPFWEDLRRLPHLRKISISRWCDQRMMGQALRGTPIVFSRKPDPNMLSVDVKLNEEAWSAGIGETLEAARGCFVEFIIRDVYTVHGELGNARRAVELARREIDRAGY